MANTNVEQFSSVDRLYLTVKEMAITFRIRPGGRLNEVELAQSLGTSRTPLREALNRLVAEGFLTFQRGRGFFCREVNPREIFELYQLRQILETAAVRLACETATQSELEALTQLLTKNERTERDLPITELVALDEQFHLALVALARNEEMTKMLHNLNAKIQFVRWIDMDDPRASTRAQHSDIVAALKARDGDLAAAKMANHIDRRLDQITGAIKEMPAH